ncbi:MAG: LPS assembly lipoprotein LptE [Pseudomonadales bacterium]
MRTAAVRGVVLLVLAVTASGCGFQLRSWDIASSIESAYLTASPRNAFEAPLRQALRQAGIAEAATPGEATVVVTLLEDRRERRSVSVSSQARAAEYEVSVGVRFQVEDAQGRDLIPDQWLERQRVFRIDRDNIVGSSEEQALLEREMEADLVQQILRSLNAAAADPAGAA